jgi:hypothetical protein
LNPRLSSAAEGILPEPDKPYLFQKIKTMAQSLPADTPGATGVNALTNWTKHGTHETATISEQDAIGIVTRAASKFVAVYDGQSAKMKEFSDWAIERLAGRQGGKLGHYPQPAKVDCLRFASA